MRFSHKYGRIIHLTHDMADKGKSIVAQELVVQCLSVTAPVPVVENEYRCYDACCFATVAERWSV